MGADLKGAILDFLGLHYPASYTVDEITRRISHAGRTGTVTKNDVARTLFDLYREGGVEMAVDPTDNDTVWRGGDGSRADYAGKRPEDAAAFEREVGHAVLLLQRLGFKVEVE